MSSPVAEPLRDRAWRRVAWLVLVAAASSCMDRITLEGGGDTGIDTNPNTGDDGSMTTGDGTAGDTTCPPSQPVADPVSQAEIASSMAAIFCIAQGDCDCPERSHDDVPSCRHAMNMDFESVRSQAQAMGLTYDGQCLGQLEKAVENLGCDLADPFGPWSDILGPGRCAVFYGERLQGTPCTALSNYASDCAQGLACWHDTCVAACEAIADSRANPYGYACPPDLRMWSWGGQCSAPAAAGLPCSPAGCVAGTYRDVVVDGEVELCTCAPTVPLGGPCDDDPACGAGLCDAGICVAAPAEGAPCLQDRCADPLRCEAGICVPVPAICRVHPDNG